MVVGLTSREVFRPWCLLICEVFSVIDGIAIQGSVTKSICNAEIHIVVEFRVESNGVVHHSELGSKDHGKIIGVWDPMNKD